MRGPFYFDVAWMRPNVADEALAGPRALVSIIDDTASGVVQRPLRFSARSKAPPGDIVAQRLSGVGERLVAPPYSTISITVRRVVSSFEEEEVGKDVTPHVANPKLGRQLRHNRFPVVAVSRKQRIEVLNYRLP